MEPKILKILRMMMCSLCQVGPFLLSQSQIMCIHHFGTHNNSYKFAGLMLITDRTHGLDLSLQTGLGKIAHDAFQYSIHLFWMNHLTHLVKITGVACAFDPYFVHYVSAYKYCFNVNA